MDAVAEPPCRRRTQGQLLAGPSSLSEELRGIIYGTTVRKTRGLLAEQQKPQRRRAELRAGPPNRRGRPGARLVGLGSSNGATCGTRERQRGYLWDSGAAKGLLAGPPDPGRGGGLLAGPRIVRVALDTEGRRSSQTPAGEPAPPCGTRPSLPLTAVLLHFPTPPFPVTPSSHCSQSRSAALCDRPTPL
jgi:hypothetical protein